MSESRRGCCGCPEAPVTRRSFLAGVTTAGALTLPALAAVRPAGQSPIRLPLTVQPVFVYASHQRKNATSWRWSADIYDEKEVAAEQEHIRRDLARMASAADFPLEILPLASVRGKEEAAAVTARRYDVLVMYAAARSREVLEALAAPDRWNLIFVRHNSGRIYYMYIGVHGHFFRKGLDGFGQPGMDVHDVVVDDHADILWRLRALSGLKNTRGKTVVSIGNPGGWGEEGVLAPGRAKARWGFDIRTVSYPDLEARIKTARRDAALVEQSRQSARDYLRRNGVTLETSQDFVSNAFLLTEVFRGILDEARADAITINNCMSAIMPVSETTACLPLSLLNDEGYIALCESDFVSLPAAVLLHYVSGKPVFMGNASFPYNGCVTVSHCTAPSAMDGKNVEPVRLLTHYESDYGAAPKVEMRKGQQITVLDPDFEGKRWMGFGGQISGTPFHPICRTQIEIAVKGDTTRMAEEIRGWHWLVSYGDHLREVGYALNKAGVGWLPLS